MSRTGFLLAEDEALKKRLSDLTVSDDNSENRPVKVFFRYPEGETEKHYPFITIEMVALTQALARQQSEHSVYYTSGTGGKTIGGGASISYFPSELDQEGLDALLIDSPNDFLRTDYPIPVDLIYQISTHTRSALHDRQLTAKMLRYILPFRSNYLMIPADGTVRRLDLMGWTQADLLDGESGYKKRIFRKVYSVMINAEIPRSELSIIKQATSIVGTINAEIGTSLDNPSLSEEF